MNITDSDHPGWTKEPTCSPVERIVVQACMIGPDWERRVEYAKTATAADVDCIAKALWGNRYAGVPLESVDEVTGWHDAAESFREEYRADARVALDAMGFTISE